MREIQGGRLEIFLDANDKGSNAFDTIIGKVLNAEFADELAGRDIKDVILAFAQNQARKDPRVGNEYKFGNFSLLVTYGRCENQMPHIDLVKPNYQFALYLSKMSPRTMFVAEGSIDPVRTVGALVKLWETASELKVSDDAPVPHNIVKALEQDEGIRTLLEGFGDVLHPEQTLEHKYEMKHFNVGPGVVASLPGSVVHAGPSSETTRAVLFFSGSPKDADASEEYNPDRQYNGVTLMGHLVSILWTKPKIGKKERIFLLQKLAKYVTATRKSDVALQLGASGKLYDFVVAVQGKEYGMTKCGETKTLEKFISDRATCKTMEIIGDELTDGNGDPMDDSDDFTDEDSD